MPKIITTSFAKSKSREWFDGKKAKLLVKYRNIGNEEIEKDTIVEILHREVGKIQFNVRNPKTGVFIYKVWCEHLELLEDASN